MKALLEKKYPPLLLCFAAGILGAIPYFFESLFILTFVSQIFLFYVFFALRQKKERVFTPFFCYFAGLYFPAYSFLAELYPFDRFGFSEGQAVFVVICACVGIPLLHAVTEACVMLLSKLCPGGNADIPVFAALWVLCDWILSVGGLAFPWCSTAVSATGFLPYIQTASLFGTYFITFVTVAGCAAFAKFLLLRKRAFIISACALLCGNTVLGTVLYFFSPVESGSIDAALIQGNVLSNEKWESNRYQNIFDKYTSLANEAAENGAKLIVLPETAIPGAFTQNGAVYSSLAATASRYDAVILLGTSLIEDGNTFNSVVAICPDGSVSERYDKRHLVPFGEYVPFADALSLLSFIKELSEDSSALTQGTEPVVLKTDLGSIGAMVCFDSIFPAFSRESVQNGAQCIAVVTNDSWFNDSIGVTTHLRHSQLRAIETGKYILRAANTGISAFISPNGGIYADADALSERIVYSRISMTDSITLYTYIGDIALYASFATVLSFIAIKFIRRKKGWNQ